MESFLGAWGGIIGGGLGVAVFFILLGFLKRTVKVTSPDKLLVVTGRRTVHDGKAFGFSVERGRTFALPYFQSVGSLDLGVFPITVRVEAVNSANGITVGADATACVCIDDDDPAMLYSAVERLMGKNISSIHDQIQQTLIGNFRGALNKATPLQAIGMEEAAGGDEATAERAGHAERAQFRAELLKDINSDLRSFGMKVVSVSLQKIWDGSNYIANLAQKTLAEKRRQVEIEEARLRAIARQAESDSERRIQVAKAAADERIITSRQALEVYRREASGQVREAELRAERGIDEARNKGEALVQAQMVELQKLKNRTSVTLEASAKEEAARTLAQGERESVLIREGASNDILKRKAELLQRFGDDAASVVFIQQKLPALFEQYRAQAAKAAEVDTLVVMNDEEGFVGAVNRGPRAFADFLETFKKAFGIDVGRLLASPDKEART
jgi:uncharacterized membrane protein YqiK